MLPTVRRCSAKTLPKLLEAVNKALDDMQKDGAYKTISEKYFGARRLQIRKSSHE